jgi:preprotein translocase subunit SecG
MMIVFLMIIHIIISALLVLSILVQSSKGGALDGLVGSAATNALGGQGASKFLKQATVVLAVVFTVSCVVFAIYLRDARPGSSKAVDMLKEQTQQSAPVETEALPEAPAPAESE